MKRKYIIIVIYILILIFLGGWIYFVSMFSYTYPPIKEYKFQVSISNLRSIMVNTLEDHDKYEYKFTDTISDGGNGYAYYIDVRIKSQKMDNSYTCKFYSKKFRPNNLIIDLIGAFDSINKTGGYKLKDPDVINLVQIFNSEFIDKLDFKKNLK